MQVDLRILRYDPERDETPHWETYAVEAGPMEGVPKSSGRFNPARTSAPTLAKVLTVPRASPACGSALPSGRSGYS